MIFNPSSCDAKSLFSPEPTASASAFPSISRNPQSAIRNPSQSKIQNPKSKIRHNPARRLETAKALLAEYEQRIGHRRRELRFATGLAGLDAAMGGGLARGALCEITAAAAGVGAMSLALTVARAAAGGQQPVFLIDPRGEFYPPAAEAWA